MVRIALSLDQFFYPLGILFNKLMSFKKEGRNNEKNSYSSTHNFNLFLR